ncbi:uncharacterized protein LOC117391771 isoform X2 [Periophthalmus magnuspinnatus]|uniref:uncharacterized protein LOC117391771 isoform X2 n=1 Tax=Periophthalmus magnuspinnatus TaxID=409849 RepID=UPI00145A42BE|nr:uncharacterized protein LOC117391771 isoform X2 [Periophthalmus magnuspinnatus]
MDNNFILGHNGLHKTYGLLLLLIGFQQVLLTSGEGLTPTIIAPDFVTVGVPSSVECVANCVSCTYSLSLDGQTAPAQDKSVAFTVNYYTENLTVACSVTEGKQIATATKKIQVLVGPVNVSISGSDLLNPSVSQTFSCHALCRPSCVYSWRFGSGPQVSGQGNVFSVTPSEMDRSTVLICKATNTVSGLFVYATQQITVNGTVRSASTHSEMASVVLLFVGVLTIITTL